MPNWPPNPSPAVATAEGADHRPSSSRAIKIPEPILMDPRKPARVTVIMASPCIWLDHVLLPVLVFEMHKLRWGGGYGPWLRRGNALAFLCLDYL